MGELNRGERLQIMLMPEELRVIDTWRFANGCRAGQRQYGSCSSAALPPTDLGKSRMARSRRTSLFFQTGQPSSSRTISCEAVGASQPRTTLSVQVLLVASKR